MMAAMKGKRKHSGGQPPKKHGRALQVTGKIKRVDVASGFFIPENPQLDDVYLRGADLGGAQEGDRVRLHYTPSKKFRERPYGYVMEILERGLSRVVGDVNRHGSIFYLLSLSGKFFEPLSIAPADMGGAREGDRVVAEIVNYDPLSARVTEVVGREREPNLELKTVYAKHQLRKSFPEAVQKAALTLPQAPPSQAFQGRTDLRHLPTLTIDPFDARDLDDAVTYEPLGDGRFRVGVHIADVSHYVPERSTLDVEAYDRATSIYLVDRVIPMFPPELSNGICSLNAGENRLAMSVFMTYNRRGEPLETSFARTVIRVGRRFHYDEVDDILNGGPAPQGFGFLRELAELSQNLRERRMRRGSLDFDFPEVKLILDADGNVSDVRILRHTLSHQLIEEFMIGANEAVAEHLTRRGLPVVYRVHGEPDSEKIMALERFLWNLKIKFKLGLKPPPQKLQELLKRVEGSPWEKVVNYQLLRALPKAKYSTINIGHFGLGSECYCHFTSPIRRYPDVAVHRVLGELLAGRKLSPKAVESLARRMAESAEHASKRELEAMEAERESVKVKLLEHMSTRIGETFDATVAGVASFGMFIQLPNTVEGLVHVSNLRGDRFMLDSSGAILVGRRSGTQYQVGTAVRVRIERVDLPLRQLDLTLV